MEGNPMFSRKKRPFGLLESSAQRLAFVAYELWSGELAAFSGGKDPKLESSRYLNLTTVTLGYRTMTGLTYVFTCNAVADSDGRNWKLVDPRYWIKEDQVTAAGHLYVDLQGRHFYIQCTVDNRDIQGVVGSSAHDRREIAYGEGWRPCHGGYGPRFYTAWITAEEKIMF